MGIPRRPCRGDFAGEEAAAYGYAASLRKNKQARFPLSFRSSRGFLATAVEIGHSNLLSVTLLHFGNAQTSLVLRSISATVLLELVHNTEI